MNTGTKYRYYKCCVTGKDRSMQTSDPEHRLSKRVQSYKGKQCPWELRATLAKGEGQWKIRLPLTKIAIAELSGDLIDQDCDLFSLLQTPSSRQQVEQVIRSKSFARYYFRKYGKGLSNLTENDAKYMASLIREANAKNSDIWPYPLTKYQNEPLQVCLELL
mmetsp:Transcript_3906/g.5952  ORF Transcript_3906/g.5952 Transcript_3906/m.5952 type:complete len:162 (+) Transcript_3906:150-635(+)